ncbi:MAG: beta-propeller repeat-containing protein [Conexibacter sp.]|nr:beta-propeller repeat-containing protein [Conexibacter sp.]
MSRPRPRVLVRRVRFRHALLGGALLALAGGGIAVAEVDRSQGELGPSRFLTANGRHLTPEGRLTAVGNFPTGGALSPDGRFYWAVDSGHGQDDVEIVDVASGRVTQRLPLPGAYGGIAFAHDGRTAYVSGEPRGGTTPSGPTKADAGDAIHVFAVDPASGHADESDPLQLPPRPAATPRAKGRRRAGRSASP